VEIYEPILKDSEGKVTTGLLHAVRYLKDNRLLPHGFDKAAAGKDIVVTGDAADDPEFTDRGSSVRYVGLDRERNGTDRSSRGGTLVHPSGFGGRIIWHLTRRRNRNEWCGITRRRPGSRL
jgi:hypothetical protein